MNAPNRAVIKIRFHQNLIVDNAELDSEIADMLKRCGYECQSYPETFEELDSHVLASFDVLLIDWRDSNSDVADFYKQCGCRSPVIALIHDDQALPNSEELTGFNDFVSVSEVSAAPFRFRAERLIQRYKDPLALGAINAPEAQLLQSVVNNSSDWVFVKDLEHRFLTVSDEYVSSLDLTMDSVIGKNDLDIGFSPEIVLGTGDADWPGFWPQDDKAVEGGEPTIESNPYWRVFTGDTRHRRTIRVPLKNKWGGVYGLLICSEDVTAIVKTEQVLKERSAMLEKVTHEKNNADHSRLMAELAVTSKNKFIATASHDLRQPLHALGLYLDVLENKIHGETELALISKIKNSCTALSALFNSLLDLSRLDAGVVDMEASHFPINNMLPGLREEFQEIAADKSLSISVDSSDAVIKTDAVLLERVLRNLIQNAVTYTNSGSVEVRCETFENHVRVEVADTGPGIPQYEQHAIFSEYYQLENAGQRPTIGLGLGLAIVRRLVDLLNVTFELQSETGKGSVFSIEIPLGDPALVEDDPMMDDDPNLDDRIILIIDDDTEILDGMQHVLSTYGCIAITSESAAEAIETLTDKDVMPNMIVADYRLENGLTGDAAIESIREEFNIDIPAIIVTGDTSADRLKEATNSGFKLLHKPVQPDELVFAISNILAEPSP